MASREPNSSHKTALALVGLHCARESHNPSGTCGLAATAGVTGTASMPTVALHQLVRHSARASHGAIMTSRLLPNQTPWSGELGAQRTRHQLGAFLGSFSFRERKLSVVPKLTAVAVRKSGLTSIPGPRLRPESAEAILGTAAEAPQDPVTASAAEAAAETKAAAPPRARTAATAAAPEAAAVEPPWPTAAYVHLPFCRRRCHYCDFAIVPIGNRTEGQPAVARMTDYVRLVQREMDACRRHWPRSNAHVMATEEAGPATLSSVYFGGGTPSLIPPHLLGDVLSCLDSNFGIRPDAEISMEIDPGTFDAAKLRKFLELGVNRVSLGVQAFQDNLLKVCGRAHTLSDVYRAVDIVVNDCDMDNWSLDLMCSLPHQTDADWRFSLSEAIRLAPSHISVYDLQIEAGTPFGRRYSPGETPLPSDSASADMFRLASHTLRDAGYEHYEISNYARRDEVGGKCFKSRHNLVYWRNRPYLAFGMSAASYVDEVRFTRPRSLNDYGEWVGDYEKADGSFKEAEGTPAVGGDEAGRRSDRQDGGEDSGELDHAGHSARERLLDAVMLGLRLAEGINLNEFADEFGLDAANNVIATLKQFVASGHVRVWNGLHDTNQMLLLNWAGGPSEDGPRVALTDPEGFLVSNDVIASVFSKLDAYE